MGAFSERGDHVIPVSGKDSILIVEVVNLLASLVLIPIVSPTFLRRRIDTTLLFLSIRISVNRQIRISPANRKPGLLTVFAGLHSSGT